MSDEILHQRHAEENRRLHGAFLAGAPAAIAFAFHQTADRTLEWSLLPILFAVLAWGGSFAAGVWASRWLQMAVKANLAINFADRAQQHDLKQQAHQWFTERRDKVTMFQELQLWLLLLGAAFYLGGHIWHLAGSVPPTRIAHADESSTITPLRPS